jgi:hypothetical protein
VSCDEQTGSSPWTWPCRCWDLGCHAMLLGGGASRDVNLHVDRTQSAVWRGGRQTSNEKKSDFNGILRSIKALWVSGWFRTPRTLGSNGSSVRRRASTHAVRSAPSHPYATGGGGGGVSTTSAAPTCPQHPAPIRDFRYS